MHHTYRKRTERVGLVLDPELRAELEREAARRDSSMSSAIRALIRAQLAAIHSDNRQVA
ncbi:MAG TPA: ribbon-helix-helix protein, CopG family [Bosea sp. (in: a-proteobacteria)]|jgi:metal-responsive CopG/Arc/MetJ family transcriptional regulator|uniref:ribbon-helix-helix protein, CopG family n=1 Tax=Bosea sp. (in: a-proteobacteria) TaxID=1871050 RepID=UPI002E134DEE|nr:ribbon-helix-helix protein, CopG family [Bosea sp. (in: a-proteobacteria)]